jgi:ABC-2 type transport system ATP-binding protein
VTTPALATTELTKHYGSTRALVDLDLEVAPAQVFGYLGPNGAGKTTTIRLLLDLIRPTSGRAVVLGLDCRTQSIDVRRRVGYLPGELELYEDMTARELFRYFGALRGSRAQPYAEELSERLDLDASRKIGTLSKGNKQKVGLIQAFMLKPDLLILDEPSSGLDPLVQHEFHKILQETVAEGRTVFLSSHVLSEIEHLAHVVGIIRSGSLVVVERIEKLKEKAARRVEFLFAEPVPRDSFTAIESVREAVFNDRVAIFTVEGSVDRLLKAVARFEVVDMISHEPDLEEVFLEYYREDADA